MGCVYPEFNYYHPFAIRLRCGVAAKKGTTLHFHHTAASAEGFVSESSADKTK